MLSRISTRRLGALGAAFALLVGSSPAAAQGSYGDSVGLGQVNIPGGAKSKAGKGLRFGNNVFHVGLSFQAGWDSNVGFEDSNENPASSAFIRLVPKLYLGSFAKPGSKKAPRFFYNLGLGLDYRYYLQTFNADKHFVGASLNFDMLYNPQGIFTFGFVERFLRTTEPRIGIERNRSRDHNRLGLTVKVRPGGGLISISLRYLFLLDFYEPNSRAGLNDLQFANAMQHKIRLKAAWRFFPKTSFWLSVETGFNHFFSQGFDVAGLGDLAASGNRNSIPLRIILGVTGRITNKFTADVGIGYAGAFYQGPQAPQHNDALAIIGFGFAFTPTIKLSAGYRHDFKDSIISDYYVSETAYLRLVMGFIQRLNIGLQAAFTHANYKRFFNNVVDQGCGPPNGCSRKDNLLVFGVSVDYYFLSWLSIGVAYDLWANFSDFDATIGGDPAGAGWIKHHVFGRISAYY